jgi:integrase
MRGDGRLFQQRGSAVWWAAYYVDGEKVRESTGQREAKEAAKYLKARIKEKYGSEVGGPAFILPAAKRLTIAELCQALRADLKLGGKFSKQTASHLKKAEVAFGSERAVKLTAEKIDGYISDRLAAGDRPATVNRVTQLLNQSFELAIQRGTLSRKPDIRRLSEKGNERKVSVSEKQLADFLAALRDRDRDLADFAEWCAACGMRKGEASELRWNMLHQDRLEIPAAICKNDEAHVLPLVGELADIIERRKKARRMESPYIFTRIMRGKVRKINTFDKARRTAACKANLPANFVFHSLRSVAATNLINAGVFPLVALKVGGWKTDSMLKRYCIFTTKDMREAILQTEAYRREQAQKAARVVAMR